MTLRIIDNGKNNKVELHESVVEKGDGIITINGDNNIVTVQKTIYKFGGQLTLNGNSTFVCEENINAPNIFVHSASGSRVYIGKGCSFNGMVRLLLHEAKEIKIGDGCLFASEVDITISDMHSILDKDTDERLNPAKSITIGNRVWIGERCLILKGSTIGDESIIGAGSILAKNIPRNCVAAGNPVNIMRVNVKWDHRLL